MVRVRRTARAEDDLLQIWSFIARDSIAAADRTLDRLDGATGRLATFPYLGPARDDIAPGFRYLAVGSYLILYRVLSDGVEVVRYVHGRRDLRAVLSRP